MTSLFIGSKMKFAISKTKLINDCSLLFDTKIFNYVFFVKSLSSLELKAAYKKKAFETHPDRACVLGKSREIMDKHFKKIATAYESLNSIVQGKVKYLIKDDVPKKRKARFTNCYKYVKKKNSTDYFYKGDMPKRKLLIGQFLYYSRLISWQTLLEALQWQRKQRPIIGKIAMDWGILTSDEIQRILSERSYKDKFGEFALRNGFITYFQLLAIIGRQKNLQPPIGKYFIQEKILGYLDIEKMINRQKNHNRNVLNSNRLYSLC
jgi:hypothetical protein